VIGVRRITEGLMNPNWQLSTTTGVYAIKQLRDADPSAGRRQQSVLPLLAARGLPVPEVIGDQVGALRRWWTGHRDEFDKALE
jgi:phosphotransferase family enzyme